MHPHHRGKDALLGDNSKNFTFAFAGDNLKKVEAGEQTIVMDKDQTTIGYVLTCVTDMGITWHDNRILSIASENQPPDIKIKGLSCGFVKVDKKLAYGERILLKGGKRQIEVTVVSDIRPDRTARKAVSNFI